jgi:protein-tyrosine phosphatase
VFVGGVKDAENFEGVRLCVRDEAPPDSLRSTHLPVYDAESDRPILPNLDRLAGMVADARSRGEPVLLFCGHGVRRSPMAAAWYLHRSKGLSLEAAYELLSSVRPQVETPKEWTKGWKVLETGTGTGPTPR